MSKICSGPSQIGTHSTFPGHTHNLLFPAWEPDTLSLTSLEPWHLESPPFLAPLQPPKKQGVASMPVLQGCTRLHTQAHTHVHAHTYTHRHMTLVAVLIMVIVTVIII